MKYIRWREDAGSWETTNTPDAKVGDLHPAGRFVAPKCAWRRKILAMSWSEQTGILYPILGGPRDEPAGDEVVKHDG